MSKLKELTWENHKKAERMGHAPVSYTHLTLPTKA